MKTENLFNMFNALLALELAEKTQTPRSMQTPQTPQSMQTPQTMQTPQSMQTPQTQLTYSPRQWNDYTQTQQTPQSMQTQSPYDLGAQIEALTKAVQSNAIMYSEQPEAMTADEALASIINPQKGSEK